MWGLRRVQRPAGAGHSLRVSDRVRVHSKGQEGSRSRDARAAEGQTSKADTWCVHRRGAELRESPRPKLPPRLVLRRAMVDLREGGADGAISTRVCTVAL